MDDTPMQDTNAPLPPSGQLSEQAKVHIGHIALLSRYNLIGPLPSSRLNAEQPLAIRTSGPHSSILTTRNAFNP
jgi:hypothetical protein